MSERRDLEGGSDGSKPYPTPMLSPLVKRLRNAKRLQRISRFQEVYDLVPLVFGNHVLLQQLGDDRPSFTLVPIRSSRSWLGFTHIFSTVDCVEFPENKVNFTASKRYNRTTQACETTRGRVSTGPDGENRKISAPLTVGGGSPTERNDSCTEIATTTSNRCLITDGGTSVHQQVLDDNGVGQDNDYENKAYGGSEAAIEAIEAYVDEYVADERIASSRSIANTTTGVRIQEVGKTLGAHLRGDTPDGFLADVEVSKWRDTEPVKWVFERVAGEADTRRSRQLQKPDLVRELTSATGAGGARYETVERDGVRWERANTTIDWMHDVLAAVCEAVDHRPTAVQEAEDLDRREWIDRLTRDGTTDVLERALDIDAPGVRRDWNKETLRAIHDVVVAGRNPSEVEL